MTNTTDTLNPASTPLVAQELDALNATLGIDNLGACEFYNALIPLMNTLRSNPRITVLPGAASALTTHP
jgi:hypothetical protein